MGVALKKVIGRVVLAAVLTATVVTPAFAATNREYFVGTWKAQVGSVNGAKNGNFHYLSKGEAQVAITSTKNVTGKHPVKISLYRYRSNQTDVYYGDIFITSDGVTKTFGIATDVASSKYYLTMDGGYKYDQVSVYGYLQNK